ncbi:hypothetical protein G6F56_002783 [Rhizopus delemar]|uniref:Cysteine-rich protein n=1 Tax=Rhizopus stolonifer TaxID=4846 RepID=A0A367KJ61_RHIST|nr:hypothetical protein G6F56_002783 [Rhizopus delemar]RCI02275.1 hypothetical protein CU098_002822 [Rhizopus stolonifer]
MKIQVFVLLILSFLVCICQAGPISYAICQTGCNAVGVACYSAAGFVFGTITGGLGAPPAVIACNAGLGVCMAACVAAGCTPTP